GSGRDILVLIRGGYYSLDEPLCFTATDGGERIETNLPSGAFEYHKLKDHFVTYAAYPGEQPVIIGGSEIKGWKEEGNGIWSAKVNVEKIDELFVNGKRQTLARYPNEGFLPMAEQPEDPNWFKYKNGDIKNWDGIENGRVRMKVRWTSKNVGISKVDEKEQKLYLDETTEDMLYVPPIYYIENVESLMDIGGEWFFNQEEGIIKLIPTQEVKNMKDAFVAIPNIPDLIKIKGTSNNPVRNLRFYGLKFTITAPGGESTINLAYAKNCEILNNKITNVSGHAIFIGLGCYNNLISQNEIANVKKGVGIINSGSPHPAMWEDINSDNVISYNKVENMQLHSGGIATKNAIRTVISHNYVTGTYSYGITVGSWPNVEESIDGSHLVEYNNVSFTNQGRDDEGGMAVYGLSHGSIVRNNLIHDVTPAETNENVGLFFQNMAKDWTVTDNIFYNLKQGELKYCAAYPIDNIYEGNFVIETPNIEPEKIITGKPKFTYSNINIIANTEYSTGKLVKVSATVHNEGSTGIENVRLYINGKVTQTKKFAVIKGNERTIQFTYKFTDPGEHSIAIEDAPYSKINISGKSLNSLCNNLIASNTELPVGDTIFVESVVENMRNEDRTESVNCIVDGKIFATQKIKLQRGESKKVEFPISLPEGKYTITVGEQHPITIRFYQYKSIDITKEDLSQYCSGTAKPCEFEVANNRFEITASGTDFLHAEDSYGAVYLPKVIHGNFIATVKVVEFGERVSEWFRAGIFVRNDISKSN
ncbi:MAG: right-handed parallel beta-helix repeat-containing protein, partial [Melioribacteraceae bacterium]|nr:right-handed parallel beta-helix repeat-containing protein [Melioribacteraceae bacterium]